MDQIDRKTETQIEKEFQKDSPIRKLIRMFRTNTVVKHHIQGAASTKPQGVAKTFFRNSYSYNTSVIPGYTSYDRFARYCLTGDTKIATNTAEGFITIKDVVEKFNKGEKVFVFAYDKNKDEIVLSPIENAWLTKNDFVYEIETDKGFKFRCTEDHPIMLRDGSYKKACELNVSDALMPLYTKELKKYKISKNSYRAIYSFSRKWIGEHKLVAERKIGRTISSSENLHVHHKDFNGLNNLQENLEVMPAEEHLELHRHLSEKFSKLISTRWEEGGDLRSLIKPGISFPPYKRGAKKEKDPNKKTRNRKIQKWNNPNVDENLTLELICKNWEPSITLTALSKKMKESICKIQKRILWAGYENYVDFVRKNFDKNYNLHWAKSQKRENMPNVQQIYSCYNTAKSQTRVAQELKCTPGVILRTIKTAGFNSWYDFVENYRNCKVLSIKQLNIKEDVYDITVPNYNNFAICDENRCGIFVHNSDYCEEVSHPIIGKALQIYADETTQRDENGKILTVVSKNTQIQSIIQDLFDNVLHLNGKKIYKIARDLCKYGDDFQLIDITTDHGVVNLIKMPPAEVEREEGYDKKEPTAVRFRWVAKQNTEIPNAFVAHFRLDGDDMFWPYGQSILEAARRPWRQTVMLEDSMMIYRITRSAERRVFYFDVGGIDPAGLDEAINKFNEGIKKKKLVNDRGQMDLRYGATMDMVEDFVIPVKNKESATRIDTLPGGQNIGDVEDVQMFENKLFAALGVPKAFLTYDDAIGSKQVLTHEDIRFARTIQKIQEAIINELVKIAIIHLYMKGIRGRELYDFKIRMTNPSTVAELQKIELWRARLEAVQSAGQGVFDTTFIYKNFLRLSDEAIDMIRKGQIQDKIFQTKLMAIESAGAGGMAGGMGGMGAMGGLGGGMGGLGGMDMGMGGLGGGAPMGDLGGAPPAVGGMPAIPMESFNPAADVLPGAARKDLSRRNANERIKTIRGVPEDEVISANDILDSPGESMDVDGIRRDIESPFGMREHISDMLKLHTGISGLFEGSYTEISATHNDDLVDFLEGLGISQAGNKNMLTEHFYSPEQEDESMILPEDWENLTKPTVETEILKEIKE